MIARLARQSVVTMLTVAVIAAPSVASLPTCCGARGGSSEIKTCCCRSAATMGAKKSCCARKANACCAAKQVSEESGAALLKLPSQSCTCKARRNMPALAEKQSESDERELVGCLANPTIGAAAISACERFVAGDFGELKSPPGRNLLSLLCRWVI